MRNGRSLPELWGGVECTVNRVGDASFDQLEYSGHARRLDDLDRFAELGLARLRFPVLWERTAPCAEKPDRFDFSDHGLRRLSELGVRPIVGLLHHGSGPRHTSLLDPCFAEEFAGYAERVARRYPDVGAYTPINEPLTTARFSGLYGHWYPHRRDDRAFVRILLNETHATARAMRAIRAVNSHAALIQTEDMGYVRSTPKLRYQADFENERRHLNLDLLCGRVDRAHPLYAYLISNGASERELGRLRDDPTPPDVIGMNYYVTSERFLDEHVTHHPALRHGGNGRDIYADVEAVRACPEGLYGPGRILLDLYERLRRPIAVTEIHLGSSVDQQRSWLDYVVGEALGAAARGVPIVGLTVWALLGAFGWDALVTRPRGKYEPGVFELVGGAPQPTELAEHVRALARGELPEVTSGWWTLPGRLQPPPSAIPREPREDASKALRV